jgi:hypothetical protein
MLNPNDTTNIEEIKPAFNNASAVGDTLLDLLELFAIKSLCSKNGMQKLKGYPVKEILVVLILFPFMHIGTVRAFFLSQFNHLTAAKKDTFFRLKNNENYNWRNLLYLFAKRFETLAERRLDEAFDTPETPKCLILDDTTTPKEGQKIEFISKVFDHSSRRHIFGFKELVLGFWDGKSLIPLDFSIHNEKGKNKKRPFGLLIRQLKQRFSKGRSETSAGYKRTKEVTIDKITNGIAMIKRAVKRGFVPAYVLTDSWFSSEKLIQTIRRLKKGLIHFLGMVKLDKRLYEYQGQHLNAKELKKLLKSRMKRAKNFNAYYIEVIVNYGEIGRVKLFLTRFSRRSKWRLLLSTDLQLSFQQAIKIYNIRWSIEVMFKECKQLLNLGKCQSNDFDAQIADATICFIVFIMLSFHKRIHSYTSLGELFAKYRDDFIEATVAEKLWHLFLFVQLTIAEIFEIDYVTMIRVIFQSLKIQKAINSLFKIVFESDFDVGYAKNHLPAQFGISRLVIVN